MQLIAGRTGQEYNQRKGKQGAFWEDRYHATAIETDEHLHRCLIYMDLNMVRAGVVNHPEKWKESGFIEIQKPPKRYTIIDLPSLSEVSGFADLRDFQRAHRQWVEQGLESGFAVRDDAGLKRSRWAVWHLLRTSRISSVSKPHIEMLLRQMAVMRCANRRKLTDSNLSLKMRL